MTSIGTKIAPINMSEVLKHAIKKLDVFFMDCFVAIKDMMSSAFVQTITGAKNMYITPET